MTTHQMTTEYTYTDTPIGRLLLHGDERGLAGILFAKNGKTAEPLKGWRKSAPPFNETIDQLAAYFAGELREFDLPLVPEGTPFQLATWQELQRIPYGQTISYGELARRIRRPKAVRAVGAANGRNPLPIVVPCHRVIGSGGKLTGFGGGLDTKRYLLKLEGALSR
ncbi:MAG: methylated-DNA--[protein]-cysteine S-methyltransferase [bacterium]